MGISCGCEFGDPDWYYDHGDQKPVDRKRSTRCVSCKKVIKPGEIAAHFVRWRSPSTDIEEKIHGDEVPLATWYMCQKCYAIYKALDALHVCVELGMDRMEDCLEEFNQEYAPKGFSLRVDGLQKE